MDLSHLNPLPPWSNRLRNTESGEAWKWKEELEIAEAMYNQWCEVFGLVAAFADTLPVEQDELLSTKSMIYQNAYIVAPKIMSAWRYFVPDQNGKCCAHSFQLPSNVGTSCFCGTYRQCRLGTQKGNRRCAE